jgi:hypothetical protein
MPRTARFTDLCDWIAKRVAGHIDAITQLKEGEHVTPEATTVVCTTDVISYSNGGE